VKVTPVSESGDPPAGRGWRLDFDREAHLVVLTTRDWQSFEVDGVGYRLPRLGYTKTRNFILNGRPSSITHRFKAEPVRQWIRRQSAGRNIVLATIGFMISTGLGAGIAAGSLKERRMLSRSELTVDGRSAGTWASTLDTDGSPSWEFVAPGDPLPAF
jgi:hypothetical protein